MSKDKSGGNREEVPLGRIVLSKMYSNVFENYNTAYK